MRAEMRTDPFAGMRWNLVAVVFAIVLAGCGGTDNDPNRSTSSSSASKSPASDSSPSTDDQKSQQDPPSAKEAAHDWLEAYAKPDPKAACALQTKSYTAGEIKSSVADGSLKAGSSCEDSVKVGFLYAEGFNIDFSGAKLKLLDSDDTTAHIRYTYDFDGSPDTGDITLIRGSNNRWLVNASK
jgi:hypothetical protein